MALEKYRAKRNFNKTPEPAGQTPRPKKSPAKLFFCVQKHLARHLHYDFRLEHRGVLLSWAVPKGPSLDPTAKRLAMHVEDHPLEYGEFEGVIPEGYGSGIVVLWDRGTWTPEVDDVDEALRKGDLKFTLDGYKLKGSWVLVRTRGLSPFDRLRAPRASRGTAGSSGGSDGRSWLLIKHRDAWAGPVDITEFAPRSVKSAGDFEDILAAETPAIWKSNRPGGQIGAALERIIEKAAKLKAQPETSNRQSSVASRQSGGKPNAESAVGGEPSRGREVRQPPSGRRSSRSKA